MIWKIFGTIGAFTFIFSGFAILGDPNCVSADIGGGRIVGVSCRTDSYGAFSGDAAGAIMLFIGVGLLIFIYITSIQNYMSGTSNREIKSPRMDAITIQESNAKTISIKTCDNCGKEMEANLVVCRDCFGTTFTHKQRILKPFEYSAEEAMFAAFPQPLAPREVTNPEYKTCPMCAEEIKFAARKCRYCQHMMVP